MTSSKSTSSQRPPSKYHHIGVRALIMNLERYKHSIYNNADIPKQHSSAHEFCASGIWTDSEGI
jgi:hypothetical protein